jgi:hypothetical protein
MGAGVPAVALALKGEPPPLVGRAVRLLCEDTAGPTIAKKPAFADDSLLVCGRILAGSSDLNRRLVAVC